VNNRKQLFSWLGSSHLILKA